MTESISREALYDLVWAEPMLRVAERFKVSSSYMARVCTVMNVPRPVAGYWGMHAVGRAPAKPDLPAPTATDQLEWTPGIALNPTPRPPRVRRARRASVAHTEASPNIVDHHEHRMLAGVRAILQASKEAGGYLKPTKRLMVDVLTSKKCIDHILRTASVLFAELDRNSYTVGFVGGGHEMPRPEIDEREGSKDSSYRYRYPTPWRPDRTTVAHFGAVSVGLTLVEMSEEIEVAHVKGEYLPVSEVREMKGGSRILAGTWTSKHYWPTGRLRLIAYVSNNGLTWQRSWRESSTQSLVQSISKIIGEIKIEIPAIKALIVEAKERQRIANEKWQADHLRWQEEEAQRQREDFRKKRIAELSSFGAHEYVR